MGLLGDSWDDPKTMATLQLAAGLLGGGNFGQALGRGLTSYTGTLDQDAERKAKQALQKAQAENYASEIEQRKAAIAKQQQLQSIMGGMFGQQGPQMSPGAYSPSADGMGPTMPQQPQRQGGIAGLSLDQVVQLKAAGGPDLLEAWKLQHVGTPMGANSYITRPDGQREYLPDPSKGLLFGANGASVMPGYAESQAAIEGAKTAATKRAENQNTMAPLDRLNPQTGRPYAATTDQLIQSINGGQPQGQPVQVMSRGGTPVYSDGGNAQSASQEQLRVMRSELARPDLSPEVKAGIMREMSRLGGGQQMAQSQPQGGFAGFAGPADTARSVEQAKADVQPTQAKQAGIDGAMNAYRLVDQALSHPGMKTATGLSGIADPRNYIPGTDAKNYNVLADQLKGNAFLSAFAQLKGAGAITEVEGQKATSAIARLNQSQSTGEYQAALRDYQSVIGQGLKRMGVDPSAVNGGSSGEWGGQSAKAPTPMKGMTRGGYKFNGGDPANPANWEKQ